MAANPIKILLGIIAIALIVFAVIFFINFENKTAIAIYLMLLIVAVVLFVIVLPKLVKA